MSLAALDLRWLTALSQIAIGIFLICLALKVWWMTPARRASLFGPYLTGEGFRAVLRAWPIVFVAGLLILITGVSKGAYYERWQGDLTSEAANAIGLLEAIFAAWAAAGVAVVTARSWRGG